MAGYLKFVHKLLGNGFEMDSADNHATIMVSTEGYSLIVISEHYMIIYNHKSAEKLIKITGCENYIIKPNSSKAQIKCNWIYKNHYIFMSCFKGEKKYQIYDNSGLFVDTICISSSGTV